jgi:hypothetical protein
MDASHKIITVTNSSHHCPDQPITGLDIGNPAGGFSIALAYDRVLDEHQLIRALQKSLDRVPYFAGRIQGLDSTQPYIAPNNDGVLFTSITSATAMPTYSLDRPLKADIQNYISPIDHFTFDQNTPLLKIKLTNFSNGSILGISVSHLFCDGVSTLDFLQAWSDAACGKSLPASPFWDRNVIKRFTMEEAGESSQQIVALDQPLRFYDLPVDTKIFRLSGDLLENLHKKYPVRNRAEATRQDIITAFIFSLIATCNESDSSCSLTLVYNIRSLLGLPENYLGNAIGLRHIERTKKQINELAIADIAKLIREMYLKMATENLPQDIAFWEHKMIEGCVWSFMPKATFLTLNGGVLIDNVSKFSLYDMNFGNGQPVWLDTPPQPTPTAVCRGVLMCPTPPGTEGIDLHVTLPTEEMARLESLLESASHSLNAATGEPERAAS